MLKYFFAFITISLLSYYKILIILFRWILEQIEAGQFIQDLKMDILQAIRFVISSWNEITIDTIRNCWNHTNIIIFNEF